MDDEVEASAAAFSGAVASRSHRLVRNLVALYAAFIVVVGFALSIAIWPGGGLVRARTIAAEAIASGYAGVVLAALFLALTGLIGALLLTASRQRLLPAERAYSQAEMTRGELIGRALTHLHPGIMARQGQALVVSLGAIVTVLAAWLLWPAAGGTLPIPANAYLVAAFALAIGFPSLIAERLLNAYPAPSLPEAPSLRRLLLLVTVLLGAAGVFEIGRGIGLAWVRWPLEALLVLLALIAVEMGLRALGRLFLPPPSAAAAKAATDSIIVTVITGGPRAPSVLIRTHLGLDFTRSWALTYVKSATLPAIFLTLLLSWTLSGLKLVNADQRGVYERFGAPAAVLGPGLHLLLPWPFGKLRPVEYGTVHTIVVNASQPKATELIAAEAPPPTTMNRLWDTTHPTEAEYLVASETGGQQEFQAVSAEIRVLYRTGLTDADALQAVYGAVDQGAVVRAAADRLITRYFASHTLDQVMGAKRDALEGDLRTALANDIQADKTGAEIVAVLVEAIHPPAGAAAAYHAVQAAEIKADASISNEIGRAERTKGVAQEEKTQTLDAAEATAVETTERAKSETYAFAADRKASRLGRRAFLLERYFGDLQSALANRSMTIIDNRLSPDQAPMIDLRPYNAIGKGASDNSGNGSSSAPTPSASDLMEGFGSAGQTVTEAGTLTPALPSTGASTESAPPPMTAEFAAELAKQGEKSSDTSAGTASDSTNSQ